MNLQLFGGRGGSSGGGGRGAGGVGSKEESGFDALKRGVREDDLTEKQQTQVKDYLIDFLKDVEKLKKGESIAADKLNDYTFGCSMAEIKAMVRDFLYYDPDTKRLNMDLTEQYWDYDRRVYVSYDDEGTKWYSYYFDDRSDFKRLSKELKTGKIKGMIYEDGYETRVAGKGITVFGPRDPGGSSYFRFEQGKLPKKSK